MPRAAVGRTSAETVSYTHLDVYKRQVPVDDREQAVLVRVRTTDLPEVSVPGTVTFRFADPAAAASRVDFDIDLGRCV